MLKGYGSDLVRQIELVGEEGGLTVERIVAVHADGSGLGLFKPQSKVSRVVFPTPFSPRSP